MPGKGSMGPDNDPVFTPLGFGEVVTDVPCPKCGGTDVVHLVYGMPDAEGIAAYRRGEIALGGCVVGDGDPVYRCQACRHEWPSQEEKS